MADLFLSIPVPEGNTSTVAKQLTEETTIFMEGDRISLKVDMFDQLKDLPIGNFDITASLQDGDREVIGKFIVLPVTNDANAVSILADYVDTIEYSTLNDGNYGCIYESTNYFIMVKGWNRIDNYWVNFLPIQIYIKRTQRRSSFINDLIDYYSELPELGNDQKYLTNDSGVILTNDSGDYLTT